jgi:hypothetical protein
MKRLVVLGAGTAGTMTVNRLRNNHCTVHNSLADPPKIEIALGGKQPAARDAES